MESLDTRNVCIQLAEDLGWLEEHCRTHPDLAIHTNHLRLAAALVRNAIGPYLDRQPATPLHLAVVGGAGSGKSTVANFLIGTSAAEANPQAGFTRHPVAYVHGTQSHEWPAYLGFLGPLRKLAQPSPSNLDEDVYQIRHVSPDGPTPLGEIVIWDCPDMTTWAATGYVLRLIEVCGLADVVVFVASDERYNDEVPTQFLQMLLQAGKPVIAVLTKMKEPDAAKLIDHFTHDVLGKLPGQVAGVMAIPFLSPEELADPVHKAARFRLPLMNQVAVLTVPIAAARTRTVKTAVHHLSTSREGLLAAAKSDLAALEKWRALVHTGQSDFDARYYREYLTGEKFHRFDEALIKLIDLLELPGVGRVLSGALYIIRTPYRLLKGLVTSMLSRPATPPMPERPVMEAALRAWLDQLRAETLRRSTAHPLWSHISKGFDASLSEGAAKTFEDRFKEFQLALADDVDKTSRAIYADLEKDPIMLNSLRGGKFALDIAAIVGAFIAGGVTVWDFVWVPLAASVTQMLVEFFGHQYVENQREQTRQRQKNLAMQFVSAPMAEWLATWPLSGGSSFEKLQLVLRRVPLAITRVQEEVDKATEPSPTA
jgi:GTP-binding protein EngB required for normal cell division